MAAIYQWHFTGVEIVFTTTLYPLEAADAIDLSITLDSFSMHSIPQDAMDFGLSFVSGTLEQILIATGPYDDAMDFNLSFVSGLLEQILLTTGPYDDAMDFNLSFISGLLEDKLVRIYAPDEALEMSIVLDSLSMTPV